MQNTPRWMIALSLLMAAVMPLSGLSAQTKKLSYKQAYERQGEQLTKRLPSVRGWKDGSTYLENRTVEKDGKRRATLLEIDAATGESQEHTGKAPKKPALAKGFRLSAARATSADESGYLFVKKGDLYYYNAERDAFKRLTATKGEERNPTFSPDGKQVAYTLRHDLYVTDIETGVDYQLTDDGSTHIKNGYASWVYFEEILGRRSRYRAFWWSPDSKKIAFLRFDDHKVPMFTLYRADYKADMIHGDLETTQYPKPGDPNPMVTLGVVDVADGKTVWMDTEPEADHYLCYPMFTPDGGMVFQWMNRDQDHVILYRANLETGAKTIVYEEKQEAWIDWWTDLHFFSDNSGFLLRSDKDGWEHLYHYDWDGQLVKRITKGQWRVRSIAKVDEHNQRIFFTGFKKHSMDNHLFRVGFNGKGLKKLTADRGTHRCQVSTDGSYFIDSWNSIDEPGLMVLRDSEGKQIRELGSAKTEVLADYALGKVELFTFPSGDGYDLPARWVLPPNFDPTQKYPVLFQIYGGPDAGTVRNAWTRNNALWMAQNGIIVISVDHRGSGHFGKQSVALMHRALGTWEVQDYVAAVKYLRSKPFVDAERIGITGGSYGGYMTAMCLTKGAPYFTHGIASSSVTDWRLYDSIYTERYMDTPQDNPEGYKIGSVMEYADKLQGKLRILHGDMDDNVHMQNSIQLVSALQDELKTFEFMVYPGGRHGWGGTKRTHSTRQGLAFWFEHLLGRSFNPDVD